MTARDIPWSEATTPLEWAERELRAGRIEDVRKYVLTLSPEHRAPYRDLLTRIKQERKKVPR